MIVDRLALWRFAENASVAVCHRLGPVALDLVFSNQGACGCCGNEMICLFWATTFRLQPKGLCGSLSPMEFLWLQGKGHCRGMMSAVDRLFLCVGTAA